MEESKNSKQKKQKGLIVALVIAILIILGLVIYICYDKEIIFKSNTNKNEVTEEKKEDIDTTTEEENNDTANDTTNNTNLSDNSTTITGNDVIEVRKCTGTYKGETTETAGDGSSYTITTTYDLKEDGTFVENPGGVSSTQGVYIILNNTISLIGLRHTGGPEELSPLYYTEDNIMADDCSFIKVLKYENPFILNRQ